MGGQPLPLWEDPEKFADSLQNGLEMRVVFLKCFGRVLGSPRRPFWLHFSWKKTFQKSVSLLIHFFIDFGIDLGAQMPPKNFQKSFENLSEHFIKMLIDFSMDFATMFA